MSCCVVLYCTGKGTVFKGASFYTLTALKANSISSEFSFWLTQRYSSEDLLYVKFSLFPLQFYSYFLLLNSPRHCLRNVQKMVMLFKCLLKWIFLNEWKNKYSLVLSAWDYQWHQWQHGIINYPRHIIAGKEHETKLYPLQYLLTKYYACYLFELF